VYIRLHERAERSIYHPVSLQSLRPCEAVGHNSDLEVAPAVLRTCVACVPMAIVDDVERKWLEGRFQPRAD
jgi:hypothetical protein